MAKAKSSPMQKIECTIIGNRRLIMHNGRLANPFDPYNLKMKPLKSKQKKTDKDAEELAAYELEAAMYWSDQIGIYMPVENISRCLWEAAKLTKEGRKIIGVLVDDEKYGIGFPMIFPDHDNFDKLTGDLERRFTKIVNIRGNKVLTTRFLVPPGWKCKFTAQINDEIVNPSSVEAFVHSAGLKVGLGVWRPGSKTPGTNGTFLVDSFKLV